MGETTKVKRFKVHGGRVTHAVSERRPTTRMCALLIAPCGQCEMEHHAARRVPDPTVTCKECIRKMAPSTPEVPHE